MAKRKLLKDQDRRKLFDIPVDEASLIRHYSLSLADRLEIELRRRDHNRLGLAIQLCLMRYPGRVLGAEETPPRATRRYVAGAAPEVFALYARREETRRDHPARLKMYLDTRSATVQDRRAVLLAAIQAATMSDDGAVVASSIVATFRERGALLPAIDTIEPIGLAGRAIARRRAERILIDAEHQMPNGFDRSAFQLRYGASHKFPLRSRLAYDFALLLFPRKMVERCRCEPTRLQRPIA